MPPGAAGFSERPSFFLLIQKKCLLPQSASLLSEQKVELTGLAREKGSGREASDRQLRSPPGSRERSPGGPRAAGLRARARRPTAPL